MYKIPFLLSILFFFTSFACNTGKTTNMNYKHSDYNYKSAWNKVDSLEKKGLYKSAITIIEEIYKYANEDKDGAQKIKALFYKGKYTNYLQEDNLERFEKILRKELAKAEFPDKQLLQSILAEFYDKYLNASIWKIKKMTETTDTSSDDIQTWTLGRFIKESNRLFNASIETPKLKDISYKQYNEIFTEAINTGKMRDNLYEILAYRALEHFKNDKNYLPSTTKSFKIDNGVFLATPAVFTTIELKNNEENDPKLKTLKLFQDIERYNLETKDYEELLDITLKRLDFVYSQYVKQDKEKLYIDALDLLIHKYPSTKTVAEVLYKKAYLYNQIGNSSTDPKSRWKIKAARDICLKVEKEYKNTLGAIQCTRLRYDIEKKQLRVNIEKVSLPKENILVNLSYKNIDRVFFKIAEVSLEQYNKFKNLRDHKYEFLANLSFVNKWDVNIPNDGEYRSHSVETEISPLNKGIYVLISSTNNRFIQNDGILAYQFIHISNLSYWTQFADSYNYVFVVDRKTGKAIDNANVKLSYQEWDRKYKERRKIEFLNEKTNSKGYIRYKTHSRHNDFSVVITRDSDVLNIDEHVYANRNYDQGSSNSIMFFTDRALYRPGQTVYYKGLYIHNNTDGIPSIIKNKSGLRLEFKDANWQKIKEVNVSTNEFGTFNGSFTIPLKGLTGTFRIQEQSTGNTISFRVEEYKRPKFEVKFEDYKESYKIGDNINLTGIATTFSGFPLQDAKVIYTVKRSVSYPYFWRRYSSYYPNISNGVEIAYGEVKTDKNGKFIIPVKLFAGDLNLKEGLPNFMFEIKVDVVDMTGETHSAKKQLNAGVNDINISMSLPNLSKVDKPFEMIVNTTNHSGQKVDAKGKIKIYKLVEPKVNFRRRYWAKPDTFLYNRENFYTKFPSYAYKNDDDKHSWKIEKSVDIIDFDTHEKEKYTLALPIGEYKFVLDFDDPSGKKIHLESYSSIFSETKNPANTLLMVETDRESYKTPAGANIRWHSSIPDLNVYYSLWKRNRKRFGKNWLKLSNSDKITIKLLEEHKGGVIVENIFVYDNRFYNDTKTINIPWSEKELKFEYLSFRSKLYPGHDEEWHIKIKGENNDKIMGEILASIYDESLDKIYKQDWAKAIGYPSVNCNYSKSYGFNTSNARYFYNRDRKYFSDKQYIKIFRHLNWFGFYVNRGYYGEYKSAMYSAEVMVRSDKRLMKSAAPTPSFAEDGTSLDAYTAAANGVILENVEKTEYMSGGNDKTEESHEVQLRTNLNETVFFYPDIITDKEGNFVLKFKMNDALTKWKLRMFAHTKDLKFGYDEKEIVTQKELMITPNNPRFVREGDKLTFKARIDNLTEKSLKGNAWVELYDAESMKILESTFLKDDKNKSFTLDARGSTLVNWKMSFPKNQSNLLIYRFYAKAGDFSDAEEGILPVLTNQKLVTETMPLWVKGNQTKNFTFESLKNSVGKDLKNINFTIEATSHPIWIAIQSLPYLNNVSCENSLSFTNALFSNLLAKKITDDNPKIKRVFEKWKNTKSNIDKDAFLSNLSKNQELKNILLEETPWVLDAIDEEQQKRNIALLFDLNQVKNDKKAYVRKLNGLQNSDGGFPWFKQGKSSRYITQYIMETFGRMKHLGMLKDEREIDGFLTQAINYVNRDVVKNYKELLRLAALGKIDLKDNHLSSLMIHYMYAIQFYPEKMKNKDLQEAFYYYFGQAKKYWLNRPLYLKGMLALVLHRGHETQIAKDVLRAAEGQSIISEESGMYWKSYHGYHWWQLPIETQALMIEAFDEINNDTDIVSLLKIWLLKNKQTNRWKTDKATVSAIYSLLFDQGGTIGETALVKIYAGDKDITKDISKNEIQSGTGYYKKKWAANEIDSSLSQIKIENPNKDIAWGAVYWQYLQDLDKIETFEDTPLKIKRSLYLVKNTDRGEKMTEIKQGDILHPGNLIRVKIRLEVDREMEFIHIADQRAATFEPLQQLSGYMWQGGLGYYQNPRDTKMNFFIDFLPRGVFVLEYSLRATQSGVFSNGITELQSYYAPEFSSHSEGLKVEVK